MPAVDCPECQAPIIWQQGDPVVCPWCGWDLEAESDRNAEIEEFLSHEHP